MNGASAVPEVPEFFVWRAPDGSEVVVNYATEYGAVGLGLAVAPGGSDALHLAHTGDNDGPPSAEDVETLFADLAAAHPEARIIASSLDAFAAAVLRSRAQLPVLTSEIGDSWIHGVGSDPLLTAELERLLELRRRWLDSGALEAGNEEDTELATALLLIAEHTWGRDLKSWLPDYLNYSKADFAAARARDVVDPSRNPPATAPLAWAYAARAADELRYSALEASWVEQRSYVTRAVEALAPERAQQARAALATLRPAAREGSFGSGDALDPTAVHDVGAWRVTFGDDGSIVSLVDGAELDWAGPEHRLAAFRYQTFDERDEALWVEQYCRSIATTGWWAIPDQTKPGLDIARSQPARIFSPVLTSLTRREAGSGAGGSASAHGDGDVVVDARLAMPDLACDLWGAPRSLHLTYRFRTDGRIEIVLDVLGRTASRLPEASWFGFRPLPAPGTWRLEKLGTWIDPRDVVVGGNRSLHAVATAARDGERPFALRTPDAPLVAVGTPRLYRFENRTAEPDDGLHVNLHNNVWGTNFRMWFDEDVRYRFTLELHRR